MNKKPNPKVMVEVKMLSTTRLGQSASSQLGVHGTINIWGCLGSQFPTNLQHCAHGDNEFPVEIVAVCSVALAAAVDDDSEDDN